MKTIDPSEYVTLQLDELGRQKFEAFLDRNFPTWREREVMDPTSAVPICRTWKVGVDDIMRNALYRKQYVEIYDDYFDVDESGEVVVHFPKNIICDIDGDLTPVAVWGERRVGTSE